MAGFGVLLRRLFGESEEHGLTPSVSPVRVRPEVPASFAGANNHFALAMYGQLRARAGNLFFSPYSLLTTLAMAQAGARNKTANQMAEVLRISTSDAKLPGTPQAIVQQLNTATDVQYPLTVANSLWGQDGAPLQAEYLDMITANYGGEMKLVDFRHSADSARATINQWVEGKTNRRILELIPSGGLSADTRLAGERRLLQGKVGAPIPQHAYTRRTVHV